MYCYEINIKKSSCQTMDAVFDEYAIVEGINKTTYFIRNIKCVALMKVLNVMLSVTNLHFERSLYIISTVFNKLSTVVFRQLVNC